MDSSGTLEIGGLKYVVSLDDDQVIEGLDKQDKQFGKASDAGKKYLDGMKTAAVGLGVLSAGLVAYEKKSVDYVQQMAGNAKTLSRETGLSQIESSKLLAVTSKMGIEASSVSQAFGTLSKNIKASNDSSAEAAARHKDLENKIAGARIEIQKYNKQIKDNGDSTGELKNKVEALNIKIGDYTKQLSGAEDPLKRINVATKNADGTTRNYNDILMDIADRFKAMPDGAEKTATALDLFGRGGKDLIKTMNLGAEGIKALEDQADKLGITLSSKNIDAVNKYVTSHKKLKDNMDALKITVGNLTMPLLTNLQDRMADVTTKILQSDGPWKDIVANVLAFGGPVAGGASALLGFTANLTATIQGLGGLQGALSTTLGFISNPYVAGIVGAGIIVGGLTYLYLNQKTALEQLEDAHRKTLQSQDDLVTAQDQYSQAQLNIEGTSIRVEQAQLNYNDAVKKYGPNSLEARDANYNLQTALLAKKDAENKANEALQNMQDAEKQYAKDKSFENAIAVKADKVTGLQGLMNSLAKKIGALAQTGKGSGNDTLTALRNAFSGFAEGTDFAPGGWSWVGENGPELRYIERGSKIIPHNESMSMLDSVRQPMAATDNLGQYLSRVGTLGNVQSPEMSQSHNDNSRTYDFRGAQFAFAGREDIDYFVQQTLGRNVELTNQGLPPVRSLA